MQYTFVALAIAGAINARAQIQISGFTHRNEPPTPMNKETMALFNATTTVFTLPD